MSTNIKAEVISAEAKKAAEAVKAESNEAENTTNEAKTQTLEPEKQSAQDTLQAIGHVPVPGSGGGKGVVVKK